MAGIAEAVPISKGGYLITKPGKYTVTRNLTVKAPAGSAELVGIAIQSDGVELDLGGFSIGPNPLAPGEGTGITLGDGVKWVRVHNGRIQGIKSGVLVATASATVSECLFERLHVAGCSGNLFVLRGESLTVRHCTGTELAGGKQGIVIQTSLGGTNEISDCTIIGNGASGISAAQSAGLLVRRSSIHGCIVGFAVNAGCKLADNLTLLCGTAITGNPELAGVND